MVDFFGGNISVSFGFSKGDGDGARTGFIGGFDFRDFVVLLGTGDGDRTLTELGVLLETGDCERTRDLFGISGGVGDGVRVGFVEDVHGDSGFGGLLCLGEGDLTLTGFVESAFDFEVLADRMSCFCFCFFLAIGGRFFVVALSWKVGWGSECVRCFSSIFLASSFTSGLISTVVPNAFSCSLTLKARYGDSPLYRS